MAEADFSINSSDLSLDLKTHQINSREKSQDNPTCSLILYITE